MSTAITIPTPNTQFTQIGTANKLLVPLPAGSFIVEGQPKIWVCDAAGKGSLHTLDYSGNPSEFIIMPWSAPNTTTNTQEFMYFRKIGTSWYSSAILTLPWVPWGVRSIVGSLYDPTALDGQFLWSNFTTQAPPRTTVAPFPLTMNPGVSGVHRCHWASICTSTGGTPTLDQINQSRETAVFGTGANLISPSYVLVARHDAPIKFWFQLPDGTEISRVRGNLIDFDPNCDLAIAKLGYPAYDPNTHPIWEIEPPVIPINPQAFPAYSKGVFMELGGRLTTMQTTGYPTEWSSAMQQTPKAEILKISKSYSSSNVGAQLQSGDSGHPFVLNVAGTQFLPGAAWLAAITSTSTTASLSNVAKYIDQINAVLATVGERLNTATVTIV